MKVAGIKCPRCGCDRVGPFRYRNRHKGVFIVRFFICYRVGCKRVFSEKTGTIFHNSRLQGPVMEELEKLIRENPNMTNMAISRISGVCRDTVARYKKLIK